MLDLGIEGFSFLICWLISSERTIVVLFLFFGRWERGKEWWQLPHQLMTAVVFWGLALSMMSECW
jgi:hypothetical protein